MGPSRAFTGRRRFRTALGAPLALALLLPATGGSPAAGDPEERATGDTFRGPVTGAEYRAFRHDGTRRKSLVGPDGTVFENVAAVIAHETSGLSAVDRVLDPALRAIAADPARAAEDVRVILVLRRQPVLDAGGEARLRYGPLFAAHTSRMRAILDAIAGARDPDPGRRMQMGDRIEEERRLLPAEDLAILATLRAEVADLKARFRREVLAAGRPAALQDQAPVAERVAAIPGARLLGRSTTLSTLSAVIPAGALRDLVLASPELGAVRPVLGCAVGLDTAVGTMGASSWTGAGYDGTSSTKVAVLDTGMDSGHSALSSVVSDSAVFLAAGKLESDFNDNSTSTDDFQFHGTHVGGIVASTNSTYKGLMPGGRVMNGKCGYQTTSGGGALQDPDIMSAGDWAVDNGADVLNCSFGGGGTTDGSSALALFFDAIPYGLLSTVVVAAGNAGSGSGTVGIPGDGFNVITVGNFDDNATTTHSDNSLTSSSSRGPLDDGRRKPDISAPGTNITSTYAFWEGGNPDFVSATGTSMASPATAGGCGLLEDFAASWAPETVKALLLTNPRNTSPYPTSPNDSWGYGGIDLAAAYTNRAAVVEGTFTSSGADHVLLKPGSLSSGKRVTLAWNRHVGHNNASAPTSYIDLIDLDVYVYDEADGSYEGGSFDSLENVEQVKLGSTVSTPVIKVERYDSFPTGVTTEWWSAAAESSSALSTVDPPTLACSFTTAPTYLAAGQSFTVTVRVDNSGGVAAFAPELTLGTPAGYSITSGANPRTLARIAAGGNASATWTVTASSGPSGVRSLTAAATSDSYDETYDSAVTTVNHTLDVTAPAGSVSVNGGASWTSTVTGAALAISATDDLSGVLEMRVGNTSPGSTWEAYATSKTWNLASGADGTRTVVLEFRDRSGNVSASATDTIGVDTTPPAGTVSVQGGAAAVNGTAVTLALSASETVTGSGVTDMRFSNDGTTWGAWTGVAATADWSLVEGEGTKTVRAQFRDAVGNVSSSATDSIVLDLTAPSGSVVVNGDAAWTSTTSVTLSTSASDALSGVTDMRFSNDGVSWGAWIPYAAAAGWTLPSGDGSRTVHAQFRDGAGNVSSPGTDSIGRDGTAPSGSITLAGGAAYATGTLVDVELSASDALSGVVEMRFRNGTGAWGAWAPYAPAATRTIPAGDGVKVVGVEFRDAAGNVSAEATDSVIVDSTPPVAGVLILGGRAAINTASVTLDLSGSDALSGVEAWRASDDGATWSGWSAAVATLPWTLPAGEGPRTVYVQCRDGAGNVSAAASDGILVDLTPPTGTFVVEGDALYVMPWQPFRADLSASDGAAGSGVAEFRWSHDGGGTWSDWADVGGGSVAMARPAGRGRVTVTGAFRDAAGNASTAATDAVHLVPEAPQDLGAVKTLAGTTDEGGDIDAYVLDLLRGDLLTLKVKAKGAARGADYTLELDVFDPSGARVVTGAWPPGASKPGLSKFPAGTTGRHWVVVRPAGADADAGGTYSLGVAPKQQKASLRPAGTTVDDPIPLEAVGGATLSGTLSGAPTFPAILTPPGGGPTPFPVVGKGGKARLGPGLLDGPAGLWLLDVSDGGSVTYKLSVKGPRRVPAFEE